MLGSSSFIIHATARRHYWQGAGLLSIKTFSGGPAHYRIDSGWAALDDTRYLLLNHGQTYSIDLDADRPVESFCVFFQAGLAEDVYHSTIARDDNLLDEPHADGTPLTFFDRTYPHDNTLSPALRQLREAWPRQAHEPGWLDEQLRGLLLRLLEAQCSIRAEADQLRAARPATRIELYRRLHRARDYAAACLDAPLTLADLARVAHLSPNHLLRTFRQAFQQSPHQYITALRLERARHLLAASDRPIGDIGVAVGFSSFGSFSHLFRRRFGLSPSAYRSQVGDFR